jgi:hypothetical protein
MTVTEPVATPITSDEALPPDDPRAPTYDIPGNATQMAVAANSLPSHPVSARSRVPIPATFEHTRSVYSEIGAA